MCCRVFRHPCVLRVSEGRGVRVCTERWRRANLWVQPTHKQSHVSPAACRVAQHRFLVRTHTLAVRTPPDVMATRISADRSKGGVEPPPVGADAAVRWKKLRGGGGQKSPLQSSPGCFLFRRHARFCVIPLIVWRAAMVRSIKMPPRQASPPFFFLHKFLSLSLLPTETNRISHYSLN